MTTRLIIEKLVLVLDSAALSDVHLSWNSLGTVPTTVRRYHVYRSAAGSLYTFQGYATTTSYEDLATMVAGTTYTWFVLCEYANGTFSHRSNYVSTSISTEYIYAIAGNKHIYTIDIRSRLVPTLALDQNFSAQIGGGDPYAMHCTTNLLFVGFTGDNKIFCFDWQTTKPTLIYKSVAPPSNTVYGMLYHEPNIVWAPYGGGIVRIDYTNPASPAVVAFFLLTRGGREHYNGNAFDPDTNMIYSIQGDGNIYSMRYYTETIRNSDNWVLAPYGAVTPTGGATNHTGAQMVIQRRMTALPNVMWVLMENNGWRSYLLPIVDGTAVYSSFSPNGNPAYSGYGRCYLHQNRYLIMCQLNDSVSIYSAVVWDLNNPLAPVFVSNLGTVSSPTADLCLVTDGAITYAYLISSTKKTIHCVDISDIANPVTLSTTTLTGLATNMKVIGAYMTTAQNTGNNVTMDVL